MRTVTTVENPIPPQDLSGIVGYRFVYTYANGWQYEMYRDAGIRLHHVVRARRRRRRLSDRHGAQL